MQLVLDTRGIVVKKKNNCFWLATEANERIISPHKVSSIAITSNVMLSSAAIRLAIEHKIPIYFIDAYGRVEGQLWSASFGHLATVRRLQVSFVHTLLAASWVIDLFVAKASHQCQNLGFWANRHPAQKGLLNKAIADIDNQTVSLESYRKTTLEQCADTLRGLEGSAARAYWQALSQTMPLGWQFDNRNRHPAQDAFNACLNYTYGMLYTTVETALFSVGLDPYLGVFHADQYNKPTLSYDLIEPFRPWIDRMLTDLILNKQLDIDDFELSKDGGVLIGKANRRTLIVAYNEKMTEIADFANQRVSRRTHIYRYASRLVNTLEEIGKNEITDPKNLNL